MLSRLTNRPPRILLLVARIMRKMLGLRRLRIAERLRKKNRHEGYRFPLTPKIEAEIGAVYADSNARLNSRLSALGCLYVPTGVIAGTGAIARKAE